jgi:hypothetical protein
LRLVPEAPLVVAASVVSFDPRRSLVALAADRGVARAMPALLAAVASRVARPAGPETGEGELMGAPCGRLPRRRGYRSAQSWDWRAVLFAAAVVVGLLLLALAGGPAYAQPIVTLSVSPVEVFQGGMASIRITYSGPAADLWAAARFGADGPIVVLGLLRANVVEPTVMALSATMPNASPGAYTLYVAVVRQDVVLSFDSAPLTILRRPPAVPALSDVEKDWIAGLWHYCGAYPYRSQPWSCPLPGQWVAAMMPPGPVTVRLGARVTADIRHALEQAAAVVPEITCGTLHVSFVQDAREVPPVGTRELVLAIVDDPTQVPGGYLPQGGTVTFFKPWTESPGEITGALAVMRPMGPNGTLAHYVHDVFGHGLFWWSHLDATKLPGGTAASIMSFWVGDLASRFWTGTPPPPYFTALDRAATRAVFCSGLGPGATFDDFIAKGLVRP